MSATTAAPDGPAHSVHAIRYGCRRATRGGVFMGSDPHDAPIDMDYAVWAIGTPAGAVVVDVGFGRAEGERRGRTFLRDPVDGLALVGVDAAEVTDVVITHMHYDHAGNLDRFPNARFHVQDAEIAYVTGRSMTHRALRHSFRIDDVVEMVRLVHRDRVVFHDGDAELADGITLHRIGGHTPGQMAVRVPTERGRVLLASDTAHYYESFLRDRPFIAHESMTDMLEGYRTIRSLVDSDDHVVPGHDPLVFSRYAPPTPELAGEVAVLHEPPCRPLVDEGAPA